MTHLKPPHLTLLTALANVRGRFRKSGPFANSFATPSAKNANLFAKATFTKRCWCKPLARYRLQTTIWQL